MVHSETKAEKAIVQEMVSRYKVKALRIFMDSNQAYLMYEFMIYPPNPIKMLKILRTFFLALSFSPLPPHPNQVWISAPTPPPHPTHNFQSSCSQHVVSHYPIQYIKLYMYET